jgi:hypothetical protein
MTTISSTRHRDQWQLSNQESHSWRRMCSGGMPSRHHLRVRTPGCLRRTRQGLKCSRRSQTANQFDDWQGKQALHHDELTCQCTSGRSRLRRNTSNHWQGVLFSMSPGLRFHSESTNWDRSFCARFPSYLLLGGRRIKTWLLASTFLAIPQIGSLFKSWTAWKAQLGVTRYVASGSSSETEASML